MKLRLLSFAAALCLSTAIAQAGEIKTEPGLVRRMLQDGWTKVGEGVLQRAEGGRVETFAHGEGGLRWTARKLAARIERLEEEYAIHPTAELVGVLQNLERRLGETEKALASGAAGAEAFGSDELAACDFDGPLTAVAEPETGPSAPGVKANASASFRTSCGDIGNSYAYAYARATPAGGVMDVELQENTQYDSAWPVTATASASASGSVDCFSNALAYAWNDQLNIYRDVEDTNYSCPPAPVVASISGPTTVSRNGCVTVTWYASATGGSGTYSYKWYLGTGTFVVSARSSFSRTYCQSNQVNLRVVATDTSSPALTDEATFTTVIN